MVIPIPIDILIKASNGASDFGNKFGQPLICGSLLTFEHESGKVKLGYDKVIMLAGGIGFGKFNQSIKETPSKDDVIVILGVIITELAWVGPQYPQQTPENIVQELN